MSKRIIKVSDYYPPTYYPKIDLTKEPIETFGINDYYIIEEGKKTNEN